MKDQILDIYWISVMASKDIRINVRVTGAQRRKVDKAIAKTNKEITDMFVVSPFENKRKKEYRDFVKSNLGKQVVTQKELDGMLIKDRSDYFRKLAKL